MSKTEVILTNPDRGLLPYLDAQLEDYNSDRFLIRPFTFGSASLQGGFRIRDFAAQVVGDAYQVSMGVVVGKMIRVEDATASQIAAADLARDIDKHVRHWSRCICHGLKTEVSNFNGSIALTQDRNISSENPNGWWAVVVRSFTVEFTD